MNTYTVAELSRKTKTICSESQPVLVTNNGKPQSVVLNIQGMPIDESLSLANELYGRYCVSQLQCQARENNLTELTTDDIDTEIKAARAERRR